MKTDLKIEEKYQSLLMQNNQFNLKIFQLKYWQFPEERGKVMITPLANNSYSFKVFRKYNINSYATFCGLNGVKGTQATLLRLYG